MPGGGCDTADSGAVEYRHRMHAHLWKDVFFNLITCRGVKDCGVEQTDEEFAGGERRVGEEDIAWQ